MKFTKLEIISNKFLSYKQASLQICIFAYKDRNIIETTTKLKSSRSLYDHKDKKKCLMKIVNCHT